MFSKINFNVLKYSKMKISFWKYIFQNEIKNNLLIKQKKIILVQ